ncbi:MAG: nucleoside monophosphate kinase [Patescibacteria group bacterium]
MRITILGIQGSGKSTQAVLLGEKLKLTVIDVGGLIRQSCLTPNEKNKEACEGMKKGDLVPNDFAAEVLKERLKDKDCGKGFILDGYPRNLEQLNEYNPKIDVAILLDVQDIEAIKRLIERGRVDDTLEGISKRVSWYHERTKKVLEFYKNQGRLLVVDGNRDATIIFSDLFASLIGLYPRLI